jgi:hypothetical protein
MFILVLIEICVTAIHKILFWGYIINIGDLVAGRLPGFLHWRIIMGTRIKPVQPTEIKNIKIIREAIEQIRKKPSAAALKRHKEEEETLMKMLQK